MSEEIVRRLRSRCQESLRMIKDSLPADGEVEEEEDDISDEDTPEEDVDTTEEDTSEDEVDPDKQDTAPEQGPMPRRSEGGRASSSGEEDTTDEVPEEDPSDELDSGGGKDNVNPLDNQYAVKFALGEKVAIAYANGTATDAEAVIEGYDKEGFYRIKLPDGMVINGLTDISLTSLVKGTNESKCICGSHHFVNEGKSVVCDTCGRVIKENSQLTILSKEKSKEKNIIRPVLHPVSTANKPNISENIRKAFSRKKSLKEDEEMETDAFQELRNSLEGEFWTRLPEIVADIEELGYDVLEANGEYIVVAPKDEDDDSQMQIPLGGTARTMTLDFRKAEIV